MLRAARAADKALIADVSVFDVFAGPKAEAQMGAGKKSLAIAVRLQPTDRHPHRRRDRGGVARGRRRRREGHRRHPARLTGLPAAPALRYDAPHGTAETGDTA